MEKWFRERATDGFMIIANLPSNLVDFVDEVVPILQERGIFRTEYEAETLRGNLNLPFPINRYV